MTDRELLIEIHQFLTGKTFVAGDPASIRDMVNRYARPPLTMHFPAVMQLTVNDYNRMGALYEKLTRQLHPEPETNHDASGTDNHRPVRHLSPDTTAE